MIDDLVGKDFFDPGLGIVEIPFHGTGPDVHPSLGYHLQALDLAHPLVGLENEDPHAFDTGKSFQGGFARITRRGHQDHHFVLLFLVF